MGKMSSWVMVSITSLNYMFLKIKTAKSSKE